jgi:hypothetical protein
LLYNRVAIDDVTEAVAGVSNGNDGRGENEASDLVSLGDDPLPTISGTGFGGLVGEGFAGAIQLEGGVRFVVLVVPVVRVGVGVGICVGVGVDVEVGACVRIG